MVLDVISFIIDNLLNSMFGNTVNGYLILGILFFMFTLWLMFMIGLSRLAIFIFSLPIVIALAQSNFIMPYFQPIIFIMIGIMFGWVMLKMFISTPN